jgi:hypothetical protein
MEITAILERFLPPRSHLGILKRAGRTRLKNMTVLGEFAKRSLPYIENTPIDRKLSLIEWAKNYLKLLSL